MDFKDLRTNQDLENEGVWLMMEPDDDTEFLIRSQNSKAYEKRLNQIYQRYQQRLQRKALDPATNRKAMIEVVAATILGGWRNRKTGEPVVSEDGEKIPYTPENAQRMLGEYRQFYDWVFAQSQDITNFSDSLSEEETGN